MAVGFVPLMLCTLESHVRRPRWRKRKVIDLRDLLLPWYHYLMYICYFRGATTSCTFITSVVSLPHVHLLFPWCHYLMYICYFRGVTTSYTFVTSVVSLPHVHLLLPWCHYLMYISSARLFSLPVLSCFSHQYHLVLPAYTVLFFQQFRNNNNIIIYCSWVVTRWQWLFSM